MTILVCQWSAILFGSVPSWIFIPTIAADSFVIVGLVAWAVAITANKKGA